MKYTLRLGITGDVDLYIQHKDLNYQKRTSIFSPKYYNFTYNHKTKYTNLSSPLLLKLIKNTKIREKLLKLMGNF